MTGFLPKEKLTAYQRWEVAAFDEAEQKARAASAGQSATTASSDGEAQSMVALPTAADIERMHIEAHEQGYAAGHAEGLAAGLAKARASAERIDALMSELQVSLQDVEQHVAEQLLATAVELASQMLRQSLRVKPEIILPVVREAVAALSAHMGHPALFAHPDDAVLIRTHLGDQLAHNNWRIIEDNTLTRGGCRVELGSSVVDATTETRWRRVIESIGISQDWLSDRTA